MREISTLADILADPHFIEKGSEGEAAYRRGYQHGLEAAIDARKLPDAVLVAWSNAVARWRETGDGTVPPNPGM